MDSFCRSIAPALPIAITVSLCDGLHPRQAVILPGAPEQEVGKTALAHSDQIEDARSATPAIGQVGGIRLERSGESTAVSIAAGIDIGSAAELKAALLKALEGGKRIQIAMEAATDIDVTALQLLWAARRAARQLGVEFALRGALAQPIAGRLAELGMEELGILV